MISKINRLTEREVKKVLGRSKPFFSYGIVLNYSRNRLEKNRFAIVIGKKSVNTNVTRVFFRRMFYNIVIKELENKKGLDFVFIVKKKTKLDKNDEKSINTFTNDVNFLLSKIK